MIAFLVFIIASIKEISKMEKEPYQYKKPVFGRDALYNLLENLFNDDKLSVKEKKNLLKTGVNDHYKIIGGYRQCLVKKMMM